MKRLILCLLVGIFLMPLVSADLGTYEQYTNVSVRGNLNTTFVAVTIYYPNSTIAVNNQTMNYLRGNIWVFGFNDTDALGFYIYDYCDQSGDNCRANSFTITSTGKDTTTGNAIMIFLGVLLFFILGIILFVGNLKSKKMQIKWTFALGSFMAFLIGLNLISVLIPDALINESVVSFFDSFTAISFIMFWFAGALIIILWILTFFQTVFYKRNLKKMEQYS